ncbi:cell division protein ZapA [Methyloligella sp. 2.7D]|uniref:cell division protein ZapA n=1 Tax=unclassified Methyloligella TaxID=2625955 RepID=UPI00157DD7FB|nr:cell division protein ZapA [Methyloligella sp. GL2]QKP76823.1 cell division protein ZapA [Methyloligella sp. GL2]
MGQVSVTLNGRTYRLECGDGEEAHLIALSEHLATHVDTMKRKFGQIGDDRLVLMAALMVTDELWEARRQIEALRAELNDIVQGMSAADADNRALEKGLVNTIGAAADRLEMLTERFGLVKPGN